MTAAEIKSEYILHIIHITELVDNSFVQGWKWALSPPHITHKSTAESHINDCNK